MLDIVDGLDPVERPLEYALVLWPEYCQSTRPVRQSDVGVVERSIYDELRRTEADVLAVTLQTENGPKEVRRGKGRRRAYWDHETIQLDAEARRAGAQERKEEVSANLADKIIKHLKDDPGFIQNALSDGSFQVTLSTAETRDVGGFADYVRGECGLKVDDGFSRVIPYVLADDVNIPQVSDKDLLDRVNWLLETLKLVKERLTATLRSQLALYGSKDSCQSDLFDIEDYGVALLGLRFEPQRNGVLNVAGRLSFVKRLELEGRLNVRDVRWR